MFTLPSLAACGQKQIRVIFVAKLIDAKRYYYLVYTKTVDSVKCTLDLIGYSNSEILCYSPLSNSRARPKILYYRFMNKWVKKIFLGCIISLF